MSNDPYKTSIVLEYDLEKELNAYHAQGFSIVKILRTSLPSLDVHAPAYLVVAKAKDTK